MEVARSGNGGKLNPWAEPFVPAGWSWCRGAAPEQEAEVDDFSPEWWRLVAASPAFRDRWLRDYSALDLLDADLDADDLFSCQEDEEERKEEVAAAGNKGGGGEVVAWGIDKWWRAHFATPEVPRYAEKAPRRVSGAARVSPRTIQQPR